MGSVGSSQKVNIIGTEKQISYARDIISQAHSLGDRLLQPLVEKYERVKNRGTEKYSAEKNQQLLSKIQNRIDSVNTGFKFLNEVSTQGYNASRIIDLKNAIRTERIFISDASTLYETKTQNELLNELRQQLKK